MSSNRNKENTSPAHVANVFGDDDDEEVSIDVAEERKKRESLRSEKEAMVIEVPTQNSSDVPTEIQTQLTGPSPSHAAGVGGTFNSISHGFNTGMMMSNPFYGCYPPLGQPSQFSQSSSSYPVNNLFMQADMAAPPAAPPSRKNDLIKKKDAPKKRKLLQKRKPNPQKKGPYHDGRRTNGFS